MPPKYIRPGGDDVSANDVGGERPRDADNHNERNMNT